MKNKNKSTAVSKLRTGVLTTWNIDPNFNYLKNQKLFYLLKFWLFALNDIPINYLLQKYLTNFWKKKKKTIVFKISIFKKKYFKSEKKNIY